MNVRRVVTGHRPALGHVFRMAEFPPGLAVPLDHEAVLRDFGIGPDVLRGRPPRDPGIHRTRSIDYVVVQQATNHAWINRGDRPCKLAMVFIDASEPEEVVRLTRGPADRRA